MIERFAFPKYSFACLPPECGVPMVCKLIYGASPGSSQTTSVASHFPKTIVPIPAIGS